MIVLRYEPSPKLKFEHLNDYFESSRAKWNNNANIVLKSQCFIKPTNLGFTSERKRNREFCFSGFFRMGLGILRLGLLLVQVGPAAHLMKSQTHTTN